MGTWGYFEVAVDVLYDLLFVIVEDEARFDQAVEFGEDEGFVHVGAVL